MNQALAKQILLEQIDLVFFFLMQLIDNKEPIEYDHSLDFL